MFTRKEVDLKQMRLIYDAGYLPVSVDYRFCPEVNIIEGPMADVSDALQWVRTELPLLRFPKWPGLSADGDKVIMVGWSTGGTLAMTTAFTSLERQIRPPEAILAFFCPTDYEADCEYMNVDISFAPCKTDSVSRVEESYLSGRGCLISKRAIRPARRGPGRTGKFTTCSTILSPIIDLFFRRSPLGIPRRTKESLVCSCLSKTYAGASFCI